MKFRKKPVVVEAMKLSAYTEGQGPAPWNDYQPSPLYTWLVEGGAAFKMAQHDPGPAFMLIDTLEGVMRADIGDWIIKGVVGEFYPCKSAIFEQTYEAVEE